MKGGLYGLLGILVLGGAVYFAFFRDREEPIAERQEERRPSAEKGGSEDSRAGAGAALAGVDDPKAMLSPQLRDRIAEGLSGGDELAAKVKGLLASDPAAAAKFLAENHLFTSGEGEDFKIEMPENAKDLVVEVAIAWMDAGASNAELVAWAQSLDPGLYLLAVGPIAMWRGEGDDAGDFVKELAKLPPSSMRSRLLLKTAPYWAERDPSELRDWLASANLEPALEQMIIEDSAKKLEPEAAGLQKLSGLIEIAGTVERVPIPDLARSVGQWASEDREGAQKWIGQLREGSPQQVAIVEEVARGWYQEDAPAAEQWLSAMSDGPARDRGIESMLRQAGRNSQEGDFSRMLEWTNTMSDARSAERARNYVLMTSVRSDPAAVEDYLSTNEVPEQMRTMLEEDLAREKARRERSED